MKKIYDFQWTSISFKKCYCDSYLTKKINNDEKRLKKLDHFDSKTLTIDLLTLNLGLPSSSSTVSS